MTENQSKTHISETEDELIKSVNKAVDLFNVEEKYLLENDLSERCMCARFAMCLTKVLQETPYADYYVDVEYNRGANGKERALKRIDDKPITVDIIVHKRGYDCDYGFDNLICLEMKKSTNKEGYSHDLKRLQKMTSYNYGFCYKLGVMLVADMSNILLTVHKQFREGRDSQQNNQLQLPIHIQN